VSCETPPLRTELFEELQCHCPNVHAHGIAVAICVVRLNRPFNISDVDDAAIIGSVQSVVWKAAGGLGFGKGSEQLLTFLANTFSITLKDLKAALALLYAKGAPLTDVWFQ
jgi:hypothetical protein